MHQKTDDLSEGTYAVPDNARHLSVRALDSGDANSFRSIRLEALKSEGEYFGPIYEGAVALPKEYWHTTCSKTNKRRIFGLFNDKDPENDGLIGIMGAKQWDKDPTGDTALWWSAYLKKEYRGQGLAEPLYQAREDWTREQFKRAVFFILENNKRSAAIPETNRATQTSTELMEWPGRPTAPWRWYEKEFDKK